MKFLTKLALAAGCLMLASQTLAQTENNEGLPAAELSIASDIIAIMFPPEKREVMYQDLFKAIRAQVETGFGSDSAKQTKAEREIIDRFMDDSLGELTAYLKANSAGQFDAVGRAYARLFTEEELIKIREFAQTPAGQAYLSRSIEVLQDPDVSAWNRKYFAELKQLIDSRRTKLTAELMELYAREGIPDRLTKP